MNDDQKLLNLLGLARRARKMTTGEELVIKAMQQQQVVLIFLASDAAKNLTKSIQDKAQYRHITVISKFTSVQLSQAIGLSRKVIGILDRGFAERMVALLHS